MELFFDLFKKPIVIATTCVITFTYIYFKYKFSYWSRRGVACLPPTVPFGNTVDVLLMRKSPAEMIQHIHMSLKEAGHRFAGLYVFGIPNLILIDLKLIKLISTSEFDSFQDRDAFVFEEIDPLSSHLFSIGGHRWRSLRNKLSPSFTSAKVKMMYTLLQSCSEQLEHTIGKYANSTEPVDLKDIVTRYIADVIGTIFFGLDCNSLKDADSEFSNHCKLIFATSFFHNIRNVFVVAAPGLLRFLNISYTTAKVRNYFLGILKQTVDYRENNKIDREDILNVLMKLKNNKGINDKANGKKDKIFSDNTNNGNTSSDAKGKDDSAFEFTFTDLAANSFLFIIAALETSTNTMRFCFYELCCNIEIQSKLRREIRETVRKYNGQLTYDAVMEMAYLEKVIKETLRKYPVLAWLSRKCIQEFHIPESNVVIEKDTGLMISILAIHRDPEYYPDPMKFDPERFTEENIRNRPAFSYIPFGVGPRSCLGTRLGFTQVKLSIASTILNYKLTLNEKTDSPLIMDPTLPLLNSKSTIWMHIETANE